MSNNMTQNSKYTKISMFFLFCFDDEKNMRIFFIAVGLTWMNCFNEPIKMCRFFVFNDVRMICNTQHNISTHFEAEFQLYLMLIFFHFLTDRLLLDGFHLQCLSLLLFHFLSVNWNCVFVTPMTEICHKFQLIVEFFDFFFLLRTLVCHLASEWWTDCIVFGWQYEYMHRHRR